MKESMRVLVTGGAGYIGSQVLWKLKDLNCYSVCVDSLAYGHLKLIPKDTPFFQLDIKNIEKIEQIMKEHSINAIIHFAALKDTADSINNPSEYYDNNLGGTIRLLEACKNTGVKKIVFSSTAAVYSEPKSGKVNENSAIGPVTPYGRSKLMSELAIKDSAKAYGNQFVILRYFNVAGADELGRTGPLGSHHTSLFKKVSEVVLGRSHELKIYGDDYPTHDGTGVRDYIHVEDLADLHIRALEHLNSGGNSEIINCGYGEGFSVKDVLRAVSEVINDNVPYSIAPRRQGDLAEVVADISKLKKVWNWTPKKANLKSISKSTLDWERSN
jgi:UDP-glucose 4-epimerase